MNNVVKPICVLSFIIYLSGNCDMTAFTAPATNQRVHGYSNIVEVNVDQQLPRKYSLIPSQVIRFQMQQYPLSQHQQHDTTTSLMVAIENDQSLITETIVSDENVNMIGIKKRRRRRVRPQKKNRSSTNATPNIVTEISSIEPSIINNEQSNMGNRTKSSSSTTLQTSETDRISFPISGNLPDIYWRAIPIEHLRQHPNFIPLPEPSTITTLSNLEDVKYYRQGSYQWDTLHHGRCTTSQAVAALGFLEPMAGDFLNIPHSWRRGGIGAFIRLRENALRTLDDMNKILINSISMQSDQHAEMKSTSKNSALWSKQELIHVDVTPDTRVVPFFAANYVHITSYEHDQERKKYARKISQNDQLSKSIRMMWGNTQEATAILAAMNYFYKFDPGFIIEEIGMCGAGLSFNTTTNKPSSLIIGATPDGILRHSDGRIEALEVKNHCPFYINSLYSSKGKNKGGKKKRFSIGSMSLDDSHGHGIFSHYVPQLQLEMLCLGPECKSAVMVRLTATAGALVLRMHRDDLWIEEMLYWLHKFQSEYVEKNKPPPKNFFWESPRIEDRSRYRRFLNYTKEIKNSHVEVIGRIPNNEIQRMGEDVALFMD